MTRSWGDFDPRRVPSPCFVLDEAVLSKNLALIDGIQARCGAKVLLALKAFASPAVAKQIMSVLSGVAASGPFEARLGREAFGGEVHTFSVAFRENEFHEVISNSDHVIFNSLNQLVRFAPVALSKGVRAGLRVNPGVGSAPKPMYDPCQPGSRLGVTRESADTIPLDLLTGIHMHALCEQGLPALERSVAALEQDFAPLLAKAAWINLGGGHLLTEPHYDRDGLADLCSRLQRRYDAQIYLEPGEAIVAGAGVLVTEVLDVTHNQLDIAIVDASATCHTPDVLETPYRPDVIGADTLQSPAFEYRLAGPTCLAGDVFGDYAFETALRQGDRVLIADQAPYTMVKTNTFNGIPLPSIAVWNSESDALRIVNRFDYSDYARRL